MNTVACSAQSLNRRTGKKCQSVTDRFILPQATAAHRHVDVLAANTLHMDEKTERKSQLEQNSTLAATVSSQCCRFVQQGVEKVIFSHYPETKYTQKKYS